MEYYFNNLDATSFQRLINGILVARFGEDTRLTPLRGADGGRDAETAPNNPYYEHQITAAKPTAGLFSPLRTGRYLFQVKHHRTVDTRISDARKSVISDFENELKSNVLSRVGDEKVNYFILITNVPASKDALIGLDKKRKLLVKGQGLHADIWWGEQVTAYLDLLPSLWRTFPQLFAGGVVPILSDVADDSQGELPRAVRMTLDKQYIRDSSIRFRQIELERSLAKLFTDLDVNVSQLPENEKQCLLSVTTQLGDNLILENAPSNPSHGRAPGKQGQLTSALGALLDESSDATRRMLLEGGPGQGKSTVTQMLAQIYRHHILGKEDIDPNGRWSPPQKIRLPLRVELKNFAEWLGENKEGSVEEYLASVIRKASGGVSISIESIHKIAEKSPVILIFDGLDEVGSDDLRDTILERIMDCIDRLENVLKSDLRVVVTTRPPALTGRRDRLVNFVRFPIAPLEQNRIDSYVNRWLTVQLHDDDELREEVHQSFVRRQNEPHVKALIKNPMQLTVLLHFIRLKGPAFPDRRAELYRDYFRIVIDRDVEKSAGLRKHRPTIESLHQLLGYKIHSLTEVEQADGTLSRKQLLSLVEEWLRARGNEQITARELFKLGEERLGLIVSPQGEGEETRYGYEIQPIREYFAAAFINDQISGNAHEVFQAMVRRPFWREVALFLAGLRRLNEKADLLARAKQLDQDSDIGWRQDGRSLTLQLAQEGVFSEPPHIYSEAVEYLIDLLDPELVDAPNDPKDLFEVLPQLIKQGELKKHTDRLLKIIDRHRTTQDESLLFRLFYVLRKVAEPEKFKKAVMIYQGNSPSLKAKLRLVWPYHWGIEMRKEATSPEFWEGVPSSVWGESLLEAAIKNPLATRISAPTVNQQLLLELLAVAGTSLIRDSGYSATARTPKSTLAVWRLLELEKELIADRVLSMEQTKQGHKRLRNNKDSKDLDFTGLNKSIQTQVSKLIEVTRLVVTASEENIEEGLQEYCSTVERLLKKPGLISFLAYRYAAVLLINAYVNFNFRNQHDGKGARISEYFVDKSKGHPFIFNLRELYEEKPAKAFSSGRDRFEAVNFTFETLRFNLDPVPLRMRLKSKGELVSIADILSDHICKGKKLPFGWLKRMIFPPSILPLLIERCKGKLAKLLSTLPTFHFGYEKSERMRPRIATDVIKTGQVTAILKAVAQTENPEVLKGAQVALLYSRFLKRAGAEIVLKLVRADTTYTQFITDIFLQGRRHDVSYYPSRKPLDEKEMKVIAEVAEQILREPHSYPISVTSTAAAFLAEFSQPSFPPLQSTEVTLGIQIR